MFTSIAVGSVLRDEGFVCQTDSTGHLRICYQFGVFEKSSTGCFEG